MKLYLQSPAFHTRGSFRRQIRGVTESHSSRPRQSTHRAKTAEFQAGIRVVIPCGYEDEFGLGWWQVIREAISSLAVCWVGDRWHIGWFGCLPIRFRAGCHHFHGRYPFPFCDGFRNGKCSPNDECSFAHALASRRISPGQQFVRRENPSRSDRRIRGAASGCKHHCAD